MPTKKSVVEPKATSERMTLKGEKRARVVYMGPKGGKYVRMDGKYVSLKSLPKSGKTSKQKGGNSGMLVSLYKNPIKGEDGENMPIQLDDKQWLFLPSDTYYIHIPGTYHYIFYRTCRPSDEKCKIDYGWAHLRENWKEITSTAEKNKVKLEEKFMEKDELFEIFKKALASKNDSDSLKNSLETWKQNIETEDQKINPYTEEGRTRLEKEFADMEGDFADRMYEVSP